MRDLTFTTDAVASGVGRERQGSITVDGERIRYSVPAAMGGKGVGASPESLLVSAVTACYSLTLLYYLRKQSLPATDVAVHAEGVVAGHPEKERYARITVNPTIHGAAPEREREYQEMARLARDHCFIGQTVAAGGVSYELAEVSLVR